MTIASNAEEILDIVTVVCTNIGISFSKFQLVLICVIFGKPSQKLHFYSLIKTDIYTQCICTVPINNDVRYHLCPVHPHFFIK